MTTLIKQKGFNGKITGRCAARCHEATGKKCLCICRGVLHGKGNAQAAEFIKTWITLEPHPRHGMVLTTPVQRELEFPKEN